MQERVWSYAVLVRKSREESVEKKTATTELVYQRGIDIVVCIMALKSLKITLIKEVTLKSSVQNDELIDKITYQTFLIIFFT